MCDINCIEQHNTKTERVIMYQTYEDACEAEISRKRAKREVERHNTKWTEFLEDIGDKKIYTGREILDWLGY